VRFDLILLGGALVGTTPVRSIAASGAIALAATMALSVPTGAATAAPTGAATTSAALADTPGCVTKQEFRRVEKGWAIKRVHRLFDTKGNQTYFASGSPYYPAEQWREYRPCPKYSYVTVDYKKRQGVWRVSSKSAYWS
jgi:hypothetical protein